MTTKQMRELERQHDVVTYSITDQELESLCAEDEIYVQAWRSSLTQEQLNQLNEYIA